MALSAGYSIIGVLDVLENQGKIVLNIPVIGTDDRIPEFVDLAEFIVTVGQISDAALRKKLHDMIVEAGGRLATLIASTAYVSNYAAIGEGTVVMHKAFVNADAVIGKGCIINTFANIEHDAVIGDFCHISTGAMVNGNCIVGKETFLGSQSVMVNGTEIAEKCVIGAGALVRKNLKISGVYSGNPAVIKIKFNK